MTRIFNTVINLINDEQGATLVEYMAIAIILAAVALAGTFISVCLYILMKIAWAL